MEAEKGMSKNKSGSLVFFEVPSTFRCPICKGPLFFTYSERLDVFFVTCDNYVSCSSPWRKMPNNIPWHIHFVLTESIDIGPQYKHPAHINLEAENLKCKQAYEILSSIKSDYPKVFEDMVMQYFLHSKRLRRVLQSIDIDKIS